LAASLEMQCLNNGRETRVAKVTGFSIKHQVKMVTVHSSKAVDLNKTGNNRCQKQMRDIHQPTVTKWTTLIEPLTTTVECNGH